jgi:hypothetical protein
MGDYYSVYCKGAKQSLRFVYNEWLKEPEVLQGKFEGKDRVLAWAPIITHGLRPLRSSLVLVPVIYPSTWCGWR